MAADSVEEEILLLYSEGKWEEILEKFDKNKFLPWIWPDCGDLNFIAKSVRNQGSNSLISLGCGSGLLEWLIEEATGIEVTGIEIDGVWWKSRYSSGSFIPLVLVDPSSTGTLITLNTENSVLLFCYFNNLNAFLSYIKDFKGDCFIVIGPGEGRGTYTVPEPFEVPQEISEGWELIDQQEIRSLKDFIAVYARKKKKKTRN